MFELAGDEIVPKRAQWSRRKCGFLHILVLDAHMAPCLVSLTCLENVSEDRSSAASKVQPVRMLARHAVGESRVASQVDDLARVTRSIV